MQLEKEGCHLLAERILAIGIVVFAAFFFVMALTFESRSSVEIDPMAWPIFLTVMMMILGIILIVRSFRKQKAVVEKKTSGEEETVEELLAEDEFVYPRNLIYLFITLVIYVSLLDYLGFIFSTILVLIIATALFGMKKWSGRIVTSVLATTGFILLFPILLQSPFPRGQGVFRTISLLFY